MGEVIFKSFIAHSNRLDELYNFVEHSILQKRQKSGQNVIFRYDFAQKIDFYGTDFLPLGELKPNLVSFDRTQKTA